MKTNRQFIWIFKFACVAFILNLAFNKADLEWNYLILIACAIILLIPIGSLAYNGFRNKNEISKFLTILAIYSLLVGFLILTFVNDRKATEEKREQFKERLKELENRDPRYYPDN